jgi:peptidoglycan hydrolase CwlO-like protein
MAIVALGSPLVKADSFDAKINALNQQNSQSQAALGVLGAQAASYQDQISQLAAQISALEGQITENLNKQASLNQQIIQKQAELDHQRKVLGSDLKAMYVDDQMSTIEMLATSKNLSDYVDKEENRIVVQNKIQDTMAQIATLQKQLQEEKTQVDHLIEDQKSQQSSLSSAKAQQASLLAYNQSQQASYNAQITSNNAQVRKLRAQQEAAIAAALGGANVIRGGACGGTYPTKY